MSAESTLPTVAEAYRICRSITHRYGANFSVGFRFLPREKRQSVYATYAWCRFADDIADEPGERKSERLDEWQQELDACYASHPSHPITIALADAVKRFPIPKDAFNALIEGCRQDMVKIRYETFDELLHYCDLVATSISDLSLSIFGYRSPRAPEWGRSLSTALQLTNVTRDIGDDLTRDRIYVPAEELRQFGITEDDLFARRETAAMREMILFQVRRARGYFERAEPLLADLDFDARFPTLLMGGVYAEVLREIEREPFTPLRRRLSLPVHRKVGVVLGRLLRPHFA